MIAFIRTFPQHFGRITTSGRYRPEIDGLRFFAIALVVFAHLWTRAGRLHQHGYAISGTEGFLLKNLDPGRQGVLLFFTISGFIISSQWLRHKPNIRSYFLRRVTRIEPPYLITLTAIFLLITITGYRPEFSMSFDNDNISLWQSYLASMVYLHGLLFDSFSRLLPPAWSLEIEVEFYIIAPLVFLTYFRLPSRKHFGLLILVLTIALSLFVDQQFGNGRQRFTIIRHFPFFWLGVLLSDTYDSEGSKHFAFDLTALVGLILLALASNRFEFAVGIPKWGLYALRIASVYGMFLGAGRGILFRRICSNAWIALTGGACYSIYLTHLPVAAVATSLLVKLPLPSSLAATYAFVLAVELPLIMIVGLLFYVAIERPFMRPDWPAALMSWLRRQLVTKSSS